MLALFQEGGFPMFFLLGFGLLMLVFAGRYALVPSRTRLRMTGSLGLATGFTTLTAVCADLATVGHQVPSYLERHPGEVPSHVVLLGFAESMAPAIMGFTLLSLAALIVTVGLYREPAA